MSSVDIHGDTELAAQSCRVLSQMAQIRPVLDKIADKWTILILILIVICPKPSRFNEIKRRLDGITHKALADALKRLERNGLVTRTVLPTSPVGVEYAITPRDTPCANRSRRYAPGRSNMAANSTPPARGSISSRKRRLEPRTQGATGLEALAKPSSAALIFDAEATLPKQVVPSHRRRQTKNPPMGGFFLTR